MEMEEMEKAEEAGKADGAEWEKAKTLYFGLEEGVCAKAHCFSRIRIPLVEIGSRGERGDTLLSRTRVLYGKTGLGRGKADGLSEQNSP